MNNVYMTGIAYSLGELKPIAELNIPLNVKKEFLSEKCGLKTYSESNATAFDLAFESAQKTIETTGTLPSEIDAVLFASNSIFTNSRWGDLSNFFNKLGLVNAFPSLVALTDCCNFQTAAKHATALIRAGEYKKILLVTVDRIADVCPGNHITVRSSGINSDGSASCLISNEKGAGLEIFGGFAGKSDHQLLSDIDSSSEDILLKIFKNVRSVADDLYRKNNITPMDIAQLITNNYVTPVMKMFELATRLKNNKTFTNNVSRTAHCFAADNLINIFDFLNTPEASENATVIVMGSSAAQWSSFVARIIK